MLANPLVRIACSALLLAVAAAAQTEPPCLVGAHGALAATLTDLAQRVRAAAAQPVAEPRSRAFTVLGLLRLGDLGAARRQLDAAFAELRRPLAADDAWTIIAHGWYARATGEPLIAARASQLLELAADLPHGECFVDEALAVHAWLGLATLPPSHTVATGAAIERLRALERATWREPRAVFADAATPPATDDDLTPAAAGLLVASGDRLLRHLAASLCERADRPAPTLAAACDRLAAAVELGDHAATDAQLAIVIARAGQPDAACAGQVLDALWFAITGQRLATGAGLDERPRRLMPTLPAGHQRLVVHGLAAGAACVTMAIEALPAPIPADPTSPLATPIRVTLSRVDPGPARPLQFVVQGSGAQFVCELGPGDTFACSLPAAEARPAAATRGLLRRCAPPARAAGAPASLGSTTPAQTTAGPRRMRSAAGAVDQCAGR